MATSSESTGVLQMVEESSLHDIIKLNIQNLVKTIKKLEYCNWETDKILATDDLENWSYETTLQRKSRDSAETTAAENWSWSANWRYRWTAILIDKTWKGSSENTAINGWVMSKGGGKTTNGTGIQGMREKIRQEQMEYEKKERKLMAEEHKRQELEIMANRRKFEGKLEQDRLKHIKEAQMVPKPPRLQITKFKGTVLE